MIMIIPLKYAVSNVIGKIKQYTAEKLRKKFAFLHKVYWKEQIFWSESILFHLLVIRERPSIVCYSRFYVIECGKKMVF